MPPLKIGLTGGIASGKSQACKIFSQLGITIIDADLIARSLFLPGSPLLLFLREKFGNNIFNSDKTLDRKALRKVVFDSPQELAWLNQLTHPEIALQMKNQLDTANSEYVILDIPLLIDRSGEIPEHLAQLVDRVLVIDVPVETQIKRLCARDNIEQSDAYAIINKQSTREQKLKKADDVIDNNAGLEALESQIKLLHNQYLQFSHENKVPN